MCHKNNIGHISPRKITYISQKLKLFLCTQNGVLNENWIRENTKKGICKIYKISNISSSCVILMDEGIWIIKDSPDDVSVKQNITRVFYFIFVKFFP